MTAGETVTVILAGAAYAAHFALTHLFWLGTYPAVGFLGRAVDAGIGSDPQLAEKPPKERASLCYTWDRRMVEEADLVIAEASFPSTGLGIELQIADTEDVEVRSWACPPDRDRGSRVFPR